MSRPSAGPVDHHRGHRIEELAQHGVSLRREPGFVEGAGHQLQPTLTRRGSDRERHMPHAQPRMATLLHVPGRTPKPADEKVSEALLGTGQVGGGIHRPQDVVAGTLAVEGGHETVKAVLADGCVDILIVQ